MTTFTPETGPGVAEAQAERAKRISDIRAFADWLESSPWAPMPYENAQTEIEFARIREYGERVGVKADESLADRTQVLHRFGGFEYRVIAWHRDGRPAEPDADPTGLTPAPIARHYETGGWKGEGPGTCGIECACGVTYDGFDTLAEAKQQLDWHIAAAASQVAGRVEGGAR